MVGPHHRFGQHRLGVARHQPAPLRGDADGHYFILLLINRVDDGFGGAQRHFVLSRPTAKDNSDPDSVCQRFAPLLWFGTRRLRCAARRRVGVGLHIIFLPSADRIISTASCAVWFCVSNSGLTSVSSTEMTRPEAAIFSIARWPSR